MTPEWASFLSSVKDVVVTAGAIGGFVIALLGLSAWQRKLFGEVQWDLARRLLRSVYALREAIRYVRSPFMSSGEMAAAMKGRNDSDPAKLSAEEKERAAKWAAYEQRYVDVQKAVSELSLASLEAEVLWGPDAQTCLGPLRRCERELYANIVVYLTLEGPRLSTNAAAAFIKAEQIVFPLPDEEGVDRFAAKLDEAIATAEAFIRPRLNVK